MPATPEDLMAFLAGLGIKVDTARHAAVFTVAEARGVRGDGGGKHTKNLFLVDKKGALFLVVAHEDAAIDLPRLHHRIGASGRLSFVKPELLMAALGVTPGAVTAFAAINDTAGRVTVVLDAGLLADGGTVHCHPLVNTATTAIDAGDLVAFLRATGHEPKVVALGAAAGEL